MLSLFILLLYYYFISITISIIILIQVIVSNKTVCCGPGQRLLASYYLCLEHWGESKMLVKSKSPVSGWLSAMYLYSIVHL